MELKYERCCGLDVHKKSVVACVIMPGSEGQPSKDIRTFDTMTEIAARLYISLNTVRSHVKAIYGKLSVNNRAKAVKRAHQLDIL